MAESETAFKTLQVSGTIVDGYPHRNIGNGEYHIANKVGVPEGEWYVNLRVNGFTSASEVADEASEQGFTAVVYETSGEQSPRSPSKRKSGEKSVFVW